MYYGYKISDHTVALAERAEHDCAEVFKRIDENALKCSAKGLSAFQNARVSASLATKLRSVGTFLYISVFSFSRLIRMYTGDNK